MTSRWRHLKEGATLLGSFLSFGSALNAEVVGQAGFDFIVIDLEHGAGGEDAVLAQLQALTATGTAAVVRVESHEPSRTQRVLDLGADGVMFPRVNTGEQAVACARAMRYPPEGMRGVAGVVRASRYGADFATYREQANESLLGIIQIETAEAVRHADDIAAVPGADVLFVGPMDLTHNLGIFGQFEHPDFVQALDVTLEAARRHGKVPGILLPTPGDYDRFHHLGFRLLISGTDALLLRVAACDLAAQLRASRDRLGGGRL